MHLNKTLKKNFTKVRKLTDDPRVYRKKDGEIRMYIFLQFPIEN